MSDTPTPSLPKPDDLPTSDKRTPTPRTDVFCWYSEEYGYEIVSANVARKLERDLAVANERIKSLETERDEWRECAEELNDGVGLHYEGFYNLQKKYPKP